MKKAMIFLVLVSVLLLSGCRIFHVIQPIFTTNGSIIDIEVQVKAAGARIDTPVFCISVPDTWNVLSASYLLTTDGTPFIPGDGTFNQGDSDYMNANYAEINYVWRCYRGPFGNYNSNAYGNMFFEVEVLSTGTYTLRYSSGSVDYSMAYSIVDKKIFVDDPVDCFDNWQPRDTGISSPLEGITYGNGKYMAVGWSGTILTSPDGTTWTQETSGTIDPLYGITYDNGKYAAVGWSGKILTSPDGTTWTQETSGTSNSLYGITYGNSKFVAVGENGKILTSPDGTTWTQEIAGTNTLHGITYGNSKFVAVGLMGEILTSPDGTTWTQKTSGTTDYLQAITYGNGKYAAVGHSGEILTSPDGTTWTKESSGTTNSLNGITYGNGTFLAVGHSGEILTSPDGTTWTHRTSGTGYSFFGVIPGNNKFYVVGITPTYSGFNTGIFVRSMCNTYNLGVTIAGTGSGTVTTAPAGIDCGVDCTENFSSNTEVTLTATPADADIIFVGWSGDADCYDGAVIMDMDKTCTATFDSCMFLVKRTGTGTAYSVSLQDSYSGASDLDIFYIQTSLLTEDVDFNLPISVTIEGGYNCDYTQITGTTTISGKMTFSDGTVILKGTVQLQ